jgi:hypothetical protein
LLGCEAVILDASRIHGNEARRNSK